ncbi:MAG TPA: MFS transporter [Kofleriaceae bacterium]|nr:MFS transporter [Kofleriaceae bacterium]
MKRWLDETRRSLPDAFWLVWIGTLINRAGAFVLPLLGYYLKHERGLRQAEAALVASAYGAGLVVAGLVGGVLADRIGRRATMAGSLLGGAVMMVLLSLGRSVPAMAAAAAGLGVIGEMYRPAVMAYVGDVVPPAQRQRAFGLIYWAINLGFATAAIVGGVVAQYSFRALFFGDAATMAIYALLVVTRIRESRPPEAADPATAGSLAGVLRDRVFLIFVLLGLASSLVFYQSTITLVTYLEGQGRSPLACGSLAAINGIVIILAQPRIVSALAGVDPSRALAAAAMLAGLGFGLHGLGAALALHATAIVVWTLGEIVQSPFYSSVVTTLSSPSTRGRYQGVLGMAFGVGAMAGPPAGALAMRALGRTGPWLACAVVGVVTAGGYLATAPARRARGA